MSDTIYTVERLINGPSPDFRDFDIDGVVGKLPKLRGIEVQKVLSVR